MRIEHISGDDSIRIVGAAVVRPAPGQEVMLEFGPADGPPLFRLTMKHDQAMTLSAALQRVASQGGEWVIVEN